VASIGAFSFSGCTGLTSVTFPESVTFIGEWAFEDCYGLTSVTVLNPTPPELYDTDSFPDEIVDNGCLYVPSGSIDAYRSAECWEEFCSIEAAV